MSQIIFTSDVELSRVGVFRSYGVLGHALVLALVRLLALLDVEGSWMELNAIISTSQAASCLSSHTML